MRRFLLIFTFFRVISPVFSQERLEPRIPGDGISIEQANEIALKKWGGLGVVRSTELRFRHGRWVYQVEISDLDRRKGEYEIDAKTGGLRSARKLLDRG